MLNVKMKQKRDRQREREGKSGKKWATHVNSLEVLACKHTHTHTDSLIHTINIYDKVMWFSGREYTQELFHTLVVSLFISEVKH